MATAIGFAIMGFIGFFVRLIHIPINNIIVWVFILFKNQILLSKCIPFKWSAIQNELFQACKNTEYFITFKMLNSPKRFFFLCRGSWLWKRIVKESLSLNIHHQLSDIISFILWNTDILADTVKNCYCCKIM